jgi:flavin-dependent dehydrogenase
MLCGDAASLTDPATGEGVGHAILSGRYAAWQAIRCFEKNDFSAGFMKGYDKELYAKLWRHNRRRFLIRKTVITKSCLLNLAVTLGNNNKSVLETIKKVIE